MIDKNAKPLTEEQLALLAEADAFINRESVLRICSACGKQYKGETLTHLRNCEPDGM